MSGKKYVSVENAEYAQLRANTARLRELQANLPELLNDARRSVAQDMQGWMGTVAARQEAYERQIRQMAEEVRSIETGTAQRLAQHRRETEAALAAGLSSLREDLGQRMEQQERRLRDLVVEERRERQQAMHSMTQRIAGLEQTAEQQRRLAETWVTAAIAKADFIREHCSHQQFAPGELERLSRSLTRAKENLRGGQSQAALVTAQETYDRLADLQLTLEEREQEWQRWRAESLAGARAGLDLVGRHRECRAVDLHSQEIDVMIDVDHWTEGRLSSLDREIEALIAQVSDETHPLSTDDLRAIATKTIPEQREAIAQLVADARLAVIDSQLRISIADIVVDELIGQGYMLQEATYLDKDERRAFAARVEGFGQSEVVILVEPDAAAPGRNTLQIHSFDQADYSADEYAMRAQELRTCLMDAQLQVGPVNEVAPVADPQVRDFKALGQALSGTRRRQ